MTSESEVSFQWIIFIANCASNLLRQKLREEFPLVTPGGYLTKFYTGRLRPEVQPLTLSYTILAEKVPLLYTFY